MIRRIAVAVMLSPSLLWAQSQQDFATRRAELIARIPDGVFVALGGHEPPQDYLKFEQTPAFYYLTGFREADAALVMIKQAGSLRSATMFVRPRQPNEEVWTGSRAGVQGVTSLTGIHGRPIGEFVKVLDSLAATGHSFFVSGEFDEMDEDDIHIRTPDEQLFDHIKRTHAGLKVTTVTDTIGHLRARKSAVELTMIRNAVDITDRALKEVIPYIKPGMNEFELQALIEFTFRRNGADRPSFSTIVGSGPNSTTLHYNTDDRFIEQNDMIVMDIGASFRGYAADVTRSVPANGVFSPQQRAVYQVVRDAQAAAERQAKLGNPAHLMGDSADKVIAAGLVKLGLIESAAATYDCSAGANARQCDQYQLFYMHSIGHGIGLEVHDPEQFGFTGGIQPGSAFTIEPGIYVREHLLDEIPDTPRNRAFAAKVKPAIEQYKNIGVRIEDDYIATSQGVEWVSQVPREMNEIEAMMKQGSPGVAARDEFRVEKYRMIP